MSDAMDALYWRDEILQILYWFRGEGLGEIIRPRDLVPFVQVSEREITRHLEWLVGGSYVSRLEGEPARYQLTELGIIEGGRRFADEFAGLTGRAHGECNDPDCACRTLGPEACATRR